MASAKDLTQEFKTKLSGPLIFEEPQAQECVKRSKDCMILLVQLEAGLSHEAPLDVLDYIYSLLEQALDELEL